jgi:predicted TIM-barrel enzyme
MTITTGGHAKHPGAPGISMDEVTGFASTRLGTDYIRVIWIRCIAGDKENAMHEGNRARYARERKLLERTVNLVNAWMVKDGRNDVPSAEDFSTFVKEESDRGAVDAAYVRRKCVDGGAGSGSRSRYPREKALLRRIMDMLKDIMAARP